MSSVSLNNYLILSDNLLLQAGEVKFSLLLKVRVVLQQNVENVLQTIFRNAAELTVLGPDKHPDSNSFQIPDCGGRNLLSHGVIESYSYL